MRIREVKNNRGFKVSKKPNKEIIIALLLFFLAIGVLLFIVNQQKKLEPAQTNQEVDNNVDNDVQI